MRVYRAKLRSHGLHGGSSYSAGRFSHARPSAFGREGFSSNFMAAHQQMRICCISELEEVVVVSEVAYTRSQTHCQ